MRYRTALVTGASSGIGRAVSRRLARDGALVVLGARREGELRRVAEEIAETGGRARVLPLDVADTEATVAAIRGVDEEMGGLDLIVSCAGLGISVHGSRLAWEKVRQMCQVNFNGAIATLTAVLPQMVERRRGHVVGVSSIGAFAPLTRCAAYCATKAGLSTFLDSLRLDLKGTGVAVTAVHPGYVRTAMTAYIEKEPSIALDADDAADRLVDGLRGAPASISFPVQAAAGVRAIALLPRALRDEALLRLPGPDENA